MESLRAFSCRLAREGLRSNLGEAFIEQSRPKVDWRRLEKGMETIGSQSTELWEFEKIVVFNDWECLGLGLSCQQ